MHSQSRILPNIEDLFMAELYNCKLDVLAADELYCALHNIALNILSSCLTTDQVYSWLHVYFPVRQANLIIAYCRHFMRTGHDTKVVIVCQLVISFIAREIARLSSMFIEHSTGGKRSIVTLKDIKTALYYDKNLQYLLFGRLPLQSYSSTPKYCSTKNNLDNSSFVNNLSDDVKLSIFLQK
ncbi:hypothetical protein GJ496_003887 [Pomphorhynchus laevis]|nr:hypothetical protein GJ496_003887 [Pomphorhynchus laevis]